MVYNNKKKRYIHIYIYIITIIIYNKIIYIIYILAHGPPGLFGRTARVLAPPNPGPGFRPPLLGPELQFPASRFQFLASRFQFLTSRLQYSVSRLRLRPPGSSLQHPSSHFDFNFRASAVFDIVLVRFLIYLNSK